MLTLDGTTMPNFGGGSGAGLGIGGGVLGGLLAGGVGGALAGGLLGNRGGGWGGNNWGGGGAATAAVATDIVLNPAFQSLQHQVDGVADQLGTNTVLEAVRHIDDQIAGYNSNTQNLIGNLATAQATSAFTTLSSINGLGRDVTVQANQNALQQLNSFNQLNTTTLQGFNNEQFQHAQGINQIIAQGTATQMAMASCCCEIKGLIQSDGDSTRSLINNLNVQNLRDQLAAANGKVSNNEQNQYLLSTILTHLHPTSVVV